MEYTYENKHNEEGSDIRSPSSEHRYKSVVFTSNDIPVIENEC